MLEDNLAVRMLPRECAAKIRLQSVLKYNWEEAIEKCNLEEESTETSSRYCFALDT
jgi:hypothetical protein